jgi:TnpA family transposase
MMAAQVGAPPCAWDLYADRDQTRRMHAIDIIRWMGLKPLDRDAHRSLSQWLLPVVMQSVQGPVLVQALMQEIRNRSIVLPAFATIERLCAEVHTRAQRRIFRKLTEGLDDHLLAALDGLLDVHKGGPITTLTWLRQPPGAPNAKSIMSHIERLKELRALNLPKDLGRDVNADRLLRMAREGAQMAVYQLKDYERLRRHATLVAIALDISATLTDQILDLHDRLMGSFFTRSKHKYADRFAADGKALNAKVRLYAEVGAALIDARKNRVDAFTAIEQILSWEEFETSVQEARQLARDEAFDSMALLTEFYGQLRRYTPALLKMFEFRAAPLRKQLLAALEVLREMNRTESDKLPDDVALDFFKPRWHRFVVTDQGVNRRFFEIAAVSELKDALRSGDVSVSGSRQFKDFEEYLLPKATFVQQKDDARLDLSVPMEAQTYLQERTERLRADLDETNRLAAAGLLPDVELGEKGLKITPLDDDVPPEAKALKALVYSMLPRIKITDLLLEVNSWVDFTKQFQHLKTGQSVQDTPLLLTAILADAFNLGLEKMADACPGVTAAKLSYLAAWNVRTETYSKALAELVNFHHQLPFSANWGDGTSSSSDGQRFKAGGHGEGTGYRNAKYGDDPGVLFYTHVSGQYDGYHIKVINGPVRDATYVLDGLLYHESDLRIEEHYTDTAGFTDHVFAMCPVVGVSYCPRIADLQDKRLYVPGKAEEWPALKSIIGGSLNTKLIETVYPDVLRMGASIKQGTVTSSLLLRKLAAYPRQNSIAVGLREMGRIERSINTLKWLNDPAYRRRVSAGLNKGEARHKLARAVFFHRLGEIRDRSFEDQQNRASGLNLVMQAITVWNTVYIERAIQALRVTMHIDPSLLAHISPLGWNHINLTGDYDWAHHRQPPAGAYRELRMPTSRPLL